MEAILLIILLAPLAASAVILLGNNQLNRRWTHSIAIAAVFASFCLSMYVLYASVWGGLGVWERDIYTWGIGGPFHFSIGFQIDRLSAWTMTVVTSFPVAAPASPFG